MPEITLVEAIRAATLAAYAPPLSFVLSRALVSSSLVAFQVSIQSAAYILSFFLAFLCFHSHIFIRPAGNSYLQLFLFFSQVTRFVRTFP